MVESKRKKWGEKDLAERAHHVTVLFIRLTLVIAGASAVVNFRWMILFVSIAVFSLTFLPAIFERRYKIDLPIEFELIAVVFIYASLFLGEVHGYYTRFWWWDIILHSGSAVALGFIGFTILYVLHKNDKLKGSAGLIALFSFFFALGIGALWEIFEFAMDQIFGFNMQKSGLIDTMWDLIVDAGGALIASVAGYFFLKNKKLKFFGNVMDRFIRENPKLFD